ncbi:membrane protein [Klebsiella pneumoniae]|nr:membrane protein [Klebsiella pneumoniae]
MAWYRDSLLGGSSWFMMKLKTPVGIGFYKSRFTAVYEGPTLIGGKYWQFSATLEVREMPMPPDGWGKYPEWLAGQSLLDIALNKEWPKHDSD